MPIQLKGVIMNTKKKIVYRENMYGFSDMANRGVCVTVMNTQEVQGVVKKSKQLCNNVMNTTSSTENDEVQVLFQKDAKKRMHNSGSINGKMDVSKSGSNEVEIICKECYNHCGIKKCDSKNNNVEVLVDGVEYVGTFVNNHCDSLSIRCINSKQHDVRTKQKRYPSKKYYDRRYKKRCMETVVHDTNNSIIMIDLSDEEVVRRESAPPHVGCGIISIDLNDQDVSRETAPPQCGSHESEISNRSQLIANGMKSKLKNEVDNNNNHRLHKPKKIHRKRVSCESGNSDKTVIINASVRGTGDVTMTYVDSVCMSNREEISANGQFIATDIDSMFLSKAKETEDIILDRVIYLPKICNKLTGVFTGANAQCQLPGSSCSGLLTLSKDWFHLSRAKKICNNFLNCRHNFCRRAEEDMKKSLAKRLCVPKIDCIAKKSKFLLNFELQLSYSNNVLAPKLINHIGPLRRTRAGQIAANLGRN